ncbi:MAG: hypothetical protein J0H41_00460 [Rhizobiales bacterium]|nr:hypothetical protein [Hyphomicrobiales bacterium]
MLGRLTKISLCVGAITWFASDDGSRNGGVDALAASAGQATLVEVKRFCAARPDHCADVLRSAVAAAASLRPRDTLTAADRAAQPSRSGG